MKRILPLLLLCMVVPVFAGEPTTAPVFQLRLVLDAPSTNSELLTPVPPKDPAKPKPEALNVAKEVLLDQTAVKSTRVIKDQLGNPQIDLKFSTAGGKRLAEITKANVGKRLAIIADGQLYSAPVIRDQITDGNAVISGSFTMEEAKALAGKITEKLKK